MNAIKILIILPLLSVVFSQECIIGKNCPYNQGICVGTSCECLDGYRTVFNPKLPQAFQIYCNYEQKHHMIALVLELFLPSFGHFYTGHFWLGIIKLVLGVTFASSSYYLYKELKKPGYIQALKETILNKILAGPFLQVNRTGIDMKDVAQLLFNITFHPFWIFYAADVYMYYSKTYYDGNGVPLF